MYLTIPSLSGSDLSPYRRFIEVRRKDLSRDRQPGDLTLTVAHLTIVLSLVHVHYRGAPQLLLGHFGRQRDFDKCNDRAWAKIFINLR